MLQSSQYNYVSFHLLYIKIYNVMNACVHLYSLHVRCGSVCVCVFAFVQVPCYAPVESFTYTQQQKTIVIHIYEYDIYRNARNVC